MVLDEMQRSLPRESIFCGDFNARGNLWGNMITNPQGEALEDALDHCDLVCINDGSTTRQSMRPGDSDSVIDLAITTLQTSAVSKWNTLGHLTTTTIHPLAWSGEEKPVCQKGPQGSSNILARMMIQSVRSDSKCAIQEKQTPTYKATSMVE